MPKRKPAGEEDADNRVTVKSFSLRPDDVQWIENATADIRRQSGLAFSQSELLRGIIRVLRERGVDLSSATSEEDIARQLSKIIKR